MNKDVLWIGLLMVGFGLVSGGCGTSDPAENDDQPIRIGAVFNTTGWMAAYDGPPRRAALLAIEDVNSSGGVLGRELTLMERDGETDPATVGVAAGLLIEEGAQLLITPCDFEIGGPASLAAQAAGLVGISTCATSPLYGSEELGDKQFTMGMWNNTMGAAMAEYGRRELGWETAWIVADTTIRYSRTLATYFAEHFISVGGEVLGEDTYGQGQGDFSPQIQRIGALDREPDVIFISSYAPDLGPIVREVRAAGIDAPIAGGDTYDDPEFIALLGAEFGNDIFMATHSWLGPEAGAEMERFIGLHEEEYGEPPSSAFSVMGWDAVKVLAEAIEAAGTTDGAAVAVAMEGMEYDGLSGTLDWTTAAEGHQPLKAAAIVEIQGGQPSFLGWYRIQRLP